MDSIGKRDVYVPDTVFFVNVYYFLNIDERKEVKRMYIKIYSKSQLVLLRRLQPLMKRKYQLPTEIINKTELILRERKLGKNGFIAILLETVINDMTGIYDILDCYPLRLWTEAFENLTVNDDGSWLTKLREWYLDILNLEDNESKVYVLYSMTL